MSPRNRTGQQGRDQQVLDGIRKDLGIMTTLYLGGKQFTPTTLEQYVQGRIDAASAVLVARAAWLQAIEDYGALRKESQTVMRDLKRLVIGAFGEQSPKLADFGFSPPRPVELTEAQKAAAVAKRAATRKARGTMGPKAKLVIKGAVDETAPAKAAEPGPK